MSRAQGIKIRKDDSQRMEDEAKQMEAKLELLRRTMDETAQAPKSQDGGRWKSGSASKPLTKGYVKSVMEAPRPKPRAPGQRTPSTGARTPVESTPRKEATQGPAFAELVSAPLAPQSGAAANLQAAMREQNKDAMEVEAFLGSLKLDRYVGLFMEHGFDCMEVVQEMQESHMQELGMAAGHILKLRKRINEMNPPPAPPPPAEENSSSKRVSFGAREEAPIPAAPKKGFVSSSLSEGTFSEEESAASFQEALKAWRSGGSEPQKPSVETSPKAGPGSFWSSMGGSEVNLERASTPLKPPAELQSSETQFAPAIGEEKLSCYQCYKQFYSQYAVERTSDLPEANGGGTKRFCSEDCANKWTLAMEKKAEAFQQRQEKLQKMKDMQQALEAERQVEAEGKPI